MAVYGYTRWADNPPADRAIKSQMPEQCSEIFEEMAPRSSQVPGPEFKRLLDRVESGDTVWFPPADRLTRDVTALQSMVSSLSDRGVKVEFLGR
ncbi:recombinase family protein [Amycolatopsis sp. NPDC004772]